MRRLLLSQRSSTIRAYRLPHARIDSKRRKDGTFKDIAHPLNSDTRDRMEKMILSEYEKQLRRIAETGELPQHDGAD